MIGATLLQVGFEIRPIYPTNTCACPWKSYTDVVQWLGVIRPSTLLCYPDPVLSAYVQVGYETTGKPIPPWLWEMNELADEELLGIVNEYAEVSRAEVSGSSGA